MVVGGLLAVRCSMGLLLCCQLTELVPNDDCGVLLLARFGLPVNFQPILIVPYKKTERRLRTTLHRLFSYLDSTADPMGTDVSNYVFTQTQCPHAHTCTLSLSVIV